MQCPNDINFKNTVLIHLFMFFVKCTVYNVIWNFIFEKIKPVYLDQTSVCFY